MWNNWFSCSSLISSCIQLSKVKKSNENIEENETWFFPKWIIMAFSKGGRYWRIKLWEYICVVICWVDTFSGKMWIWLLASNFGFLLNICNYTTQFVFCIVVLIEIWNCIDTIFSFVYKIVWIHLEMISMRILWICSNFGVIHQTNISHLSYLSNVNNFNG